MIQRKERPYREDRPNVTNAPIFALGSAVLMLGAGAVVVMSGHGGANGGNLLIGLVVSTIPSLIAAAFAERTARDVRNGTVTEKARLGASKAISEAGVVTRDGPAVQAAMQASAASTAALTTLLQNLAPKLEHNTDVTEAVADAVGAEHNGRDTERNPS